MEGEDQLYNLKEVFTGCLGVDASIVIQTILASRIGTFRKVEKNPRDIVIKFLDWSSSTFKELQGLEIEGEQIQIYPDLSIIMIWKIKKSKVFKYNSSTAQDSIPVGFSILTDCELSGTISYKN